ncbi:MAG TPA: hypothetical protein VFJ15_13025 [Oleiagrimonas sp.]|nr:hypothetical protein [Oleiagrimonas sp.]
MKKPVASAAGFFIAGWIIGDTRSTVSEMGDNPLLEGRLMKYAYLFAIITAMVLLAGCNQPDNGEIPPAGELPTPYPTQSAAPPANATPPSATSSASPDTSAQAASSTPTAAATTSLH